ncbi:hypothetical protein AB0H42_00460 [Nocardia sp. NPDC050799]
MLVTDTRGPAPALTTTASRPLGTSLPETVGGGTAFATGTLEPVGEQP